MNKYSALIVPVVLVLAGCANGSEITSSATPTPSISSSPDATAQVALYYVGDTHAGFRLYKEVSTVPLDATGDLGRSALAALVSQDTVATDPDYTNLWGNGSVINSVTVTSGVAVVDVTIAHLNVGAETEMRAIDQLVWTLTENDKAITSVTFTSQGKTLETFAGHVDATKPFTRETDYEVLASVWIDDIPIGAKRVTGTACTFEAGVAWKLLQGTSVIMQDYTTAQSGCPIRGTWSVTLPELDPGKYTFVAMDLSAEDGTVSQQDSKDFVVQ